MKRRGSTLKDYFKQSKEEHPTSHIQIIGGGEFRKKGSNVKSWKIRSYYVKEDATLMYFDPITKEPKGVINVSEVAIIEGPKENLQASGCSDFSIEIGVSLILTILSESRKMEVVFDTLKEAQKFCLLLGYVATASNLVEFVNQMQWDHIAIALQDKHERNNHRKLSTASIDSSQHSQIQSHLLQLEESRPISRSQKRTLTIDDVSGRTITSEEIKNFLEHERMDRVTSDAELNKLENQNVDGEVDIFIKKKPTIAELAAAERLHEKQSGYVIQSSDDEDNNLQSVSNINSNQNQTQTQTQNSVQKDNNVKLTRNATIIHCGYFYKQGQVRKNWKQRYFELWSTGVLLYKESKDSVVSRGQIDLKSSSLTRHEIMMTPSDDKFSLMNSSIGPQRVMALELKQATDKRIFFITFDINSPSRNASLLEQFEVALKRTSLDSSSSMTTSSNSSSSSSTTTTTTLTLPISTIIHDTSSQISSSGPSVTTPVTPMSTTRNRAFSSSNSENSSSIKKYSLFEGLKILFQVYIDYFFNKKQFNWKLFIETSLIISQIISDYVSNVVKEHKDMVLLCGAPIFLYSLVTICTRPGLISIFIFCCITSFFGAHYSNIPGLPTTEGDEEEEKETKIEE